MHRKETSVIFYQDYFKNIFALLPTQEIDLFYKLLEIAAKQFNGTYTKEFHISINQLPKDYENLIKHLRSIVMVVNVHKGSKIIEKEDINLIRRTKFTDTTFYFGIEKEILKTFMLHRKEFDYIFVKTDWMLTSKYSKFLYRILSEHIGLKFEITYEMLIMLLNLTEPKYLTEKSWGVFNREILSKSVDELNEWSDITIEYKIKKNKKNSNIVDKIIFEIHSQTPKPNDTIEEKVKFDKLVLERMIEKATKNYNVEIHKKEILDKNLYINSIIEEFDRDEIAAELMIGEWIEYIKKEFSPNITTPSLMCLYPTNTNNIYVIDNEYGLVNLIEKNHITRKPTVTLKKINNWLANDMTINFRTFKNIYEMYAISYVNYPNRN